MPKLSGREIDYSQNDMLKLTGLERREFARTLKKICKMYNLDLSLFKVEKDNENSEYFFIPEVAQLLAILIRNFYYHPLNRKTVKASDVTGMAVNQYYRKVLEDIDENVEPIIADAIYCLEGHLATQNITDWIERFSTQLTRLLLNVVRLKEQNLGDILEKATRKLDSINYNLFVGSAVLNATVDANIEALNRSGGGNAYEKKLHQQNISIDRLIAEMIRFYEPKITTVRESNFCEYDFGDDGIMTWFALCGNSNDITVTQKRHIYYQIEVNPFFDEDIRRVNFEKIAKQVVKNSTWKGISTKIAEDDFCDPREASLSEEIKGVEDEIQRCKEELEQQKQKLESLKLLKTGQSEKEREAYFKKIKNAYLEYSKQQDAEEEVYEVVDKFVGRAIYELLK